MKQRVISIIFFGLLFIFTYVILNKLFTSPHFFINTTEDFKKLSKKTNIDIIFYGSSHTFTAYNPLVVNHYCKTISYNLGSDAQRTPLTNLVLEESLRRTKPKLIILEVYAASIKFPKEKDIKGFQLSSLDFLSPFSVNKLNVVRKIYNSTEYLGVYSPLIRNHNKWNKNRYFKTSRRKYIDPKISFYYDGYIGYFNQLSEKDRNKYINFRDVPLKRSDRKQVIKNEEREELIKFIETAKKNNIEVLIVSSPDLRARIHTYNFFDELTVISENLNVPFVNLNEYHDETGITIDDFKDKSHLNIKGGVKASKFIAEYIDKNYTLPKRDDEAIWETKNKEYNEFYRKFINAEATIFNQELHFELTENVVIEGVKIVQKNNINSVNIKMQGSEIYNTSRSKYKLGVHIYPDENELSLLSDYSKSKGRKCESVDYYLDEFEDSIDFDFHAKFSSIESIKIFLYDRDQFRGVIGTPLIINKFENAN